MDLYPLPRRWGEEGEKLGGSGLLQRVDREGRAGGGDIVGQLKLLL